MIREGSEVEWNWGNGKAKGKVVSTFAKEVSKEIKGSTITRKGEKGNKALLIKQEDGAEVLKLESEVDRIS
ncbi:DUF2945 domain-containing protein [Christiangramia aquimixticola]|uniref:DUF2945 domain-containing protein n=1 Tax=Christiangramia aquimixticola TaxID=1697558 RepID=UPI003AA9698A